MADEASGANNGNRRPCERRTYLDFSTERYNDEFDLWLSVELLAFSFNKVAFQDFRDVRVS